MQHRINGFAIASLVVGTIWFFWIGSILALAFGYTARKQIRQRGERGAGLATAGIMLGWVGVGTLAIILSFGLLMVVAGTDPAPAPPIPAG
jgi:small-conductance mechanosensitive channel